MANDVVFRRINGRIVPIRRKKGETRTEKAVKGGVATALSAGVAAGSGRYASNVVLASATVEDAARTAEKAITKKVRAAATRFAKKTVPEQETLHFMAKEFQTKFKPSTEEAFRKAASLSKRSENLFKRRIIIRRAGAGIAGGLLGYGAVKGVEAATGKDLSRSDAGKVFEAAAIAGGALAGLAYYSRLGGRKAAIKKVASLLRRK